MTGIRATARAFITELLIQSGLVEADHVYDEPKGQLPFRAEKIVASVQTNNFKTSPINATSHSATFDILIVLVASDYSHAQIEDLADRIRDILLGGENVKNWSDMGIGVEETSDEIGLYAGTDSNKRAASALACQMTISVSVQRIDYQYVAPDDQGFAGLALQADLNGGDESEFSLNLIKETEDGVSETS